MPDSPPQWHPLLACEEYQPGHWVMLDQYRRPYAMIDILRRGEEVGYRVTTWEQRSADRRLLGYFTKLRAAAASGHQAFLATHTTGDSRRASVENLTRAPGKANTPARTERD